MKDEIKEILDYLKNNTFIPDETKRKYKILHRDEVNKLLDYIANLQEEKEKLKSYIKLTDEEAKEYMHDTNKEIERLNNIINELEKWIKENDLGKYRTENVVNTDELLDKLKELKEGK